MQVVIFFYGGARPHTPIGGCTPKPPPEAGHCREQSNLTSIDGVTRNKVQNNLFNIVNLTRGRHSWHDQAHYSYDVSDNDNM